MEVDFKELQFERDPWDSTLVPAEPDPAYFDTFEGLASAML
jgi:hypothetical protein